MMLWSNVFPSEIGRCWRPKQYFPLPAGVESGWLGLHQDAALPLSSITFDPCAALARAGCASNRAISERMSANICHDTTTWAIWNVM